MPWVRSGDGLALAGSPHFDAAQIQINIDMLRASRNNPQTICRELEDMIRYGIVAKKTIWRFSKWCAMSDASGALAQKIAQLFFYDTVCRRLWDSANKPIPSEEIAERDYQEWLDKVVAAGGPTSPADVQTRWAPRGVSLEKGGNVSLTKVAPGLSQVQVGLGWDVRSEGQAFDLDSSVFLLNDAGKVRTDSDFIFYNNLTSTCGAVQHLGDNQTGQGEGDDETVEVDLNRVPADIATLRFTVTIHDADARQQNFGMLGLAFIRVVNKANGQELARYNLSEEAGTETALIFGELYRRGNEWKFRAVGQGWAGGLGALARDCGVDVA